MNVEVKPPPNAASRARSRGSSSWTSPAWSGSSRRRRSWDGRSSPKPITSMAKGRRVPVARSAATHSIALKTCHVAMLDLPFKVADVIADAAGEE